MLGSVVRLARQQAVGLVALLVALGGSAYAAAELPANSVGPRQLQADAVTAAKVRPHSLLRADFKSGQMLVGPRGPEGRPGAQGAPGIQGPAGIAGAPGVSGYTVETASGTINPQETTPVTANCPAGDDVLSGGFHYGFSAAFTNVEVVDDGPVLATSQSYAGWIVQIEDDNTEKLSGPFTVYAICAKVS